MSTFLHDLLPPQEPDTVESLQKEVRELRDALVSIVKHRPWYEDDETPDEYNKRLLFEIREIARVTLTGEPKREYQK